MEHYVSFNDNSVQYKATLFTKTKGKALQYIKKHTAKVKQHFGKGLTYLQVNNGKELVNADVKRFCAEEGITIEMTAPYSPSQNGIAEHYNCTLLELICTLLLMKGLPLFLWDKAVLHTVYIRNQHQKKLFLYIAYCCFRVVAVESMFLSSV